ncbi:MAG: homoserine dehydrogenase [Magnetococcales bacterium]|nr:homoserine dehydrogenase [Magnetococcales bacterium]
MQALRIGILGFGTVGKGTARLLLEQAALLENRAGMPLQLVHIADRDPGQAHDVDLQGVPLTAEVDRVVRGEDIDVVVELIGGVTAARQFVREALLAGKHVVTANKALLAEQGADLFALARECHRELGFEAAVAGAVPIVKALREGLAANRIESLYGILNGTCNYILTRMLNEGLPFGQVLKEAQEQGYAEADPGLDIDGIDAAHKLALLAALAFDTPVEFSSLHIEGIRNISDVDIAWAREMGFRIRLLGIAKQKESALSLRVHAAMVPANSMLGSVNGVFNAILTHGSHAGTSLFYGRGAGSAPTASAVVADLIDIARNLRAGQKEPRLPGAGFLLGGKPLPQDVEPVEALQGRYYIRMTVEDVPGVLADVTTILKSNRVSISAIHQTPNAKVAAVPLVMVTHQTEERQVQQCLRQFRLLESLREGPFMIRIEEMPA